MGFHNAARPAANPHAQRRVIACEKLRDERLAPEGVIELEQAIKLKTADIRKAHRIKLPDAIIAATAIVYDLTLLSRNVADFGGIDGLKIVNPWIQ